MMNLEQNPASVVEMLKQNLGAERVSEHPEDTRLCSQDVFTRELSALAVVRPRSAEELATAVKIATENGVAAVPRGGGMSYTKGYVPVSPHSVMIDFSGMQRVLELNTDDMFVTVEAGCTWQHLHQILEPTGLRTPYWGTLSGRFATVGGAMSQNAIFWGSGQHGFAADNVISMSVVLADGSLIKTGSAAQLNSTPFTRHFGPDLTGLFCCDSGALGFKATITLPLVPQNKGRAYCAFDFKTADDTLAAMSEISRRGLAMECFGFDPYLQSQRLKRESLGSDVKALAGVMKSSGSVLGALKDGANVVLSGRRYMKDVDYSVQVMIEDFTQAGADEKAKQVAAIAKQRRGKAIGNSIPKIVRANPFGPVNSMLGPQGERWVPAHAIVSHSNAAAGHAAIMDLFAKHADGLAQHGVETGFLFATVGHNSFALEPVFFWPDSTTEIHREYVEKAHLARLPELAENLDARRFVAQLRHELAELFRERGGVHMQIGKEYHYADGIHPESLALIRAVKQHLDPNNLVNPGALGL